MNKLLQAVDLRTQLAGNNRMELLTFNLNREQKYGINVFKVREVMFCPEISEVKDQYISGMIYLRGSSLAIVDLNRVIHGEPCNNESPLLIITEFNDSQQGFLVSSVDRILNLEWNNIHPPPITMDDSSFVTATTQAGDELVQILDVEQVLEMISPTTVEVAPTTVSKMDAVMGSSNMRVIYCDDSSVARKNLATCLKSLGVDAVGFNNGAEAWRHLQDLSADQDAINAIACVISDIEMPELDGFTLTQQLKHDDRLRHIPIYLHSSLSGDFNKSKALQVGANGFLTKFNPEELAAAITACVGQAVKGAEASA